MNMEDNFKEIQELYKGLRADLTPEEQAQFDKTLDIMRSNMELKSFPRLMALDCCLTLGMSAITLHPLALEQLMTATMVVMARVIANSRNFKADPRCNQ